MKRKVKSAGLANLWKINFQIEAKNKIHGVMNLWEINFSKWSEKLNPRDLRDYEKWAASRAPEGDAQIQVLKKSE